MTDIAPCGWCGSKVLVHHQDAPEPFDWVACDNEDCAASGPIAPTEAEAIAAHNRVMRAGELPTPEALAKHLHPNGPQHLLKNAEAAAQTFLDAIRKLREERCP